MLLRTLVVGMIQTNCYLVGSDSTREAAIIDPGGDAEEILQAATDLEVQVRQIILTHFHFDHCLAAAAVRQATGAPLAIHALDAPFLADPPAVFRMASALTPVGLVADRLLGDGEHILIGDLDLAVLHTPGHSPGGIALYVASDHILFSGDTLFREGLGRTDFPGCSHETLLKSIREKLLTLPPETMVYPGHGEETTIGHERRRNPWVGARVP